MKYTKVLLEMNPSSGDPRVIKEGLDEDRDDDYVPHVFILGDRVDVFVSSDSISKAYTMMIDRLENELVRIESEYETTKVTINKSISKLRSSC